VNEHIAVPILAGETDQESALSARVLCRSMRLEVAFGVMFCLADAAVSAAE